MRASTVKPGKVDRITPQLVSAFAYMLQHPTRWIAAPELVAAAGTTKMTVYSRFANLAASGLLLTRHIDRFTHWQLAPAWREIEPGHELHRRAVEAGLIASAGKSGPGARGKR